MILTEKNIFQDEKLAFTKYTITLDNRQLLTYTNYIYACNVNS